MLNATSNIRAVAKSAVKVLLLESIHATAHELFKAEGFKIEAVPSSLNEAALKERLQGVHVLGIRSKTRVTASLLASAPDLLTVGCFCIGTNQVDLEAACQKGVPVFNAPFSNTRSVAEMMIAEIITLARQLSDRSREVHEGRWRKSSTRSYEVRGKTLGIIGYGHIGSQLGVLAEALGMRVVFYDIVSKLPMGNNHACTSLEEALEQADFVCCHVPATPQTRMMINERTLGLMKPGSYLLNASRGSVVDIAALAAALKRNHLAGAAIDVYPEEPEGQSDTFLTELQGLANVILTPHLGGSTLEAQAAIGREVGAALTGFLNRGTTIGAVNFPQVELPPSKGTYRLLNVHRNVPGVLRDINKIVSDRNANIHSQVLATDPQVGYLIVDLDQDVSLEVGEAVGALETSIRTRILY